MEGELIASEIVEEAGVGNSTLYFMSITVSYVYDECPYTVRDPFISRTGSSSRALIENKIGKMTQLRSLPLRVNPNNPTVAYLK